MGMFIGNASLSSIFNAMRALKLDTFASDYTGIHVHQNQFEQMPSKPSHGRRVTTPSVGLSGFPFK